MPGRKQLADAIRILAMDAIEAARSGHPGAPLGMADLAEVLWNDFLVHNPANPKWPGRDRFVFSNGHGSMLLYALLHLSGYDLSLGDLKQFRQLGSKTPGHPEYGVTPGVESTAGPLGQGLAMAVGMAMAEKLMAEHFNRPGFEVVNHRTFAFAGDGCLMEGISHEACSLAGTLGLGKLIVLYDDNEISIDGPVKGWFADDTPRRFEAYGWRVIPGVDGHDPQAVKAALAQATAHTDKPTLICCRTVIGQGAPGVCGTAGCHGSPLGKDEIARARAHLGWEHAPFVIPQDISQAWDARQRGAVAEARWQARFEAYADAYPELASEFVRRAKGELPEGFSEAAARLLAETQAAGPVLATRKSSQKAIGALAALLPELLGGSADLSESNGTHWSGAADLAPGQWQANYVHYGVREFGMAAAMNGMALHGGFIPFGGTFLVFADYMKSAIRLSALMAARVVYVLTHDSIGVGEDGPTHQPVEHLAMLRAIPGLETWRPCDAVEALAAWKCAVERQGPSAMALTRQNLPHQPRDAAALAGIERGGYVLKDCPGAPQALLLATGSEVALAVGAAELLAAKGIHARVVSLPCVERFAAQPQEYRDAVLPPKVRARVAVEAGVAQPWHALVGLDGAVVGMDRYGESGPGPKLFEHFGFTKEKVAEAAEQVLDSLSA